MKIEFLITIIMLLIIGACRKITNPRKKLDMSKGHTKMMVSTIILHVLIIATLFVIVWCTKILPNLPKLP